MKPFIPVDWFWVVAGDSSRAWSSAALAYVSEYPDDQYTQIANEVELFDALSRRGFANRAPQRVFSAQEVRDALLRIDVQAVGEAVTPDDLRTVATAMGVHVPPMA